MEIGNDGAKCLKSTCGGPKCNNFKIVVKIFSQTRFALPFSLAYVHPVIFENIVTQPLCFLNVI